MLFDGITLSDGTAIINSYVESGTAFPSTDVKQGRMFYLTQAVGAQAIGFYVYDGTEWVTGDISSIVAGNGLSGGGSLGDINISIDTSVTATLAWVNGNFQPLNTDLTAILSLGDTGGFLKNVSAGHWEYDTNVYLTGNQPITISGDATGTGATAINLTLINTGVTGGTYSQVTVDSKGRVISANNPTISATGDATWSTQFNGTTTATGVLTLAASGVSAGTYNIVTVNSKGLVTAGSNLQASDLNTIYGYTPLNPNQLGVANGIATLDSNAKLLTSQIPEALVGAVVYQGVWNASTNTPTLASGTGTKGNYYKVSTAGSTTIDGISQWNSGDTIIFNGTVWDKIDGLASEVISVAGRVGNIILTTDDVSEGSNLYFTTARASAAAPIQTVFGRTGSIVLLSSDVTTALGFTPANAATVASTYAPLASPSFTGTPTAPTQSYGNNSTDLATTAYVQLMIGNLSGSLSITGNTTLTSANAGNLIECNLTAASTLTLPAPTAGLKFTVWNNSTYVLTVTTPSGSIYSPPAATAASQAIPAAGNFEIISDGTNWIISGWGQVLSQLSVAGATTTFGITNTNGLSTDTLTIGGSNATFSNTDFTCNIPATFNNTTTLNGSIVFNSAVTTGQTFTFNNTVTVNGGAIFNNTITANSSLSVTGLTTLNRTVTSQNGIVINGYIDTNSPVGQLLLIDPASTYGWIFRNDGSSAYMMLTANGATTGTWSSLRPFTINLGTGSVALDGTGVGVSTGGALTVGTTLSVTGNTTLSGTLTATSGATSLSTVSVSGTTDTAVNVTAGGITVAKDVIAGGFLANSVGTIAAAGTTLATGTAIATAIANVTSGTGGVVLPATAPVGSMVFVINNTSSSINIYPPSGGQIDWTASSGPFPLASDAKCQFVCTASGQWYSLTGVYV